MDTEGVEILDPRTPQLQQRISPADRLPNTRTFHSTDRNGKVFASLLGIPLKDLPIALDRHLLFLNIAPLPANAPVLRWEARQWHGSSYLQDRTLAASEAKACEPCRVSVVFWFLRGSAAA
jgi:hypothetical protein